MTVYVIVKDAHKIFQGKKRGPTEFSIEEGECVDPGHDICQVVFSKGLRIAQEVPVLALNVFLRKEEAMNALVPILENNYLQLSDLAEYSRRGVHPNKKEASMYAHRARAVDDQLSLLRARPTKTAFDRIFRK